MKRPERPASYLLLPKYTSLFSFGAQAVADLHHATSREEPNDSVCQIKNHDA